MKPATQGIIFQNNSYSQSLEQIPTKGIVFYTDNQLTLKIAHRVQDQLKNISKEKNIPIVSVSLKPMPHFGNKNIFLLLQRSYLTLFKQILAGLETSTADIIFFCEHDVLYTPSHFDFTPSKKDVYYYNTNVWKVRFDDGFAVHYDVLQTSFLCGYRDLLIKHYKERIRRIERKLDTASNIDSYSFLVGFEPGIVGKLKKIDDFRAEVWESEIPNVDIRHGNNLTSNAESWSPEGHEDGWIESDSIPGWGSLFL